MSAWAWRTCKCGDRVHIGWYCSCGGDPWRIEAEATRAIGELESKKADLARQIAVIDELILKEKQKLPKEKKHG